MSIQICLIDDNGADGARYSERLSLAGEVDVRFVFPPVDFDVTGLLAVPTDLLLIDYELIRRQPSGRHANYFGATLATALREVQPDIPLVLLTRRTLVLWQKRRPVIEESQIFDDELYKDDIDDDANRNRSLLVTLAQGFGQLRNIPQRDWAHLIQLLQVDAKEEEALLREANPPSSEWTVAQAARWIRTVVLEYPGILYNNIHAATALRISVDSFMKPEVQQFFTAAKYSGIFAPHDGRWWRNRMFRYAEQLISESEVGDGSRQRFRDAFLGKHGIELSPSVSIQTGRSGGDWVCHILKAPVEIENTLVYHPDSRPPVMDEARVSFKAIRESQEIKDELFEVDDTELLEEIRR